MDVEEEWDILLYVLGWGVSLCLQISVCLKKKAQFFVEMLTQLVWEQMGR